MTLKKLLAIIRDLLSFSGPLFLLGDGIDKAFPYSRVTVIHQHRWLGYWMMASAIALAIRLGSFRNAAAVSQRTGDFGGAPIR